MYRTKRQNRNEIGDCSFIAEAIENEFADANIRILTEYGVPSSAIQKIFDSYRHRLKDLTEDQVIAVIIQNKRLIYRILNTYEIETLERMKKKMNRTITVKGVGSASVRPDYITISMTVESVCKDYNVSMEDAARRIEKLQDVVIESGYQKEDLKTINFDVDTRYESFHDQQGNYKREFSGYAVIYRLKLSFDMDSKRLAKVIGAISESGAAPELSIAFTVKDPAKVSEALLVSATENAKAKADILCKASGNALGQLLSIDYNWGELNVISRTRYAMEDIVQPLMAKSGLNAPDIEPDDINVSDTVTFTWEIK